MLDGETMQQEFEYEFDREFEGEFEDEYESDEFLGEVLKGSGGALGSLEGEEEYESDPFLSKIRNLARRLAPVLKQVAPKAVQAVGTAIAGPNMGQTLGSLAGQLATESEFEAEFASEFESEDEFESEFEYEAMPQPEALAEALAALASQVQSEAEAEAYTGAFTARIIPIRSVSMRRIYPRLVRGTAALTHVLRKSPRTRPLVQTIPTIAARAGQKLSRQAAQGRPITTTTAARVMAGETKKVLGNPITSARTLLRSSKAARQVTKPTPARSPV
jgi:hypothetical protein